jgi:hypothetical protein
MRNKILLSIFGMVITNLLYSQVTVSPSTVVKSNNQVVFTFSSSGSNIGFMQGSSSIGQGTNTQGSTTQGSNTQGSSTVFYLSSDVMLRFLQATSTQGSNTQGSQTMYYEQNLYPSYVYLLNSNTLQAVFDISTYLPSGYWDVVFGGYSYFGNYYNYPFVNNESVLLLDNYNNPIQGSETQGSNTQGNNDNQGSNTLGAIHSQEESNISLFPNPVSNDLHIIVDEKYTKVQYQILGITGCIVRMGELVENESILNLSDLSSGIYFVKIFDSNKILKTSKILKK